MRFRCASVLVDVGRDPPGEEMSWKLEDLVVVNGHLQMIHPRQAIDNDETPILRVQMTRPDQGRCRFPPQSGRRAKVLPGTGKLSNLCRQSH